MTTPAPPASTRKSRPPRVSVVLKRSSWRKWVEEEGDARIVALVEAGDETVRRMHPGHIDHTETIEEVKRALAVVGADVVWHDRPHHFEVRGRCDLVVTVGGDGTLLSASHNIGSKIPLLGINSSPNHSVGFFCAAKKGEAHAAIAAALGGTLERTELSRMRVELNGKALHDRVLNEALFCHASPAATSRYILRVLGAAGQAEEGEEHKSSGLWVGPAAGSTAAQRSAGGNVLPLGSSDIQYVVREPYRAHGNAPKMTVGLVRETESLSVRSRMREARLFLDGEHLSYDVTIGDVLTMRRSVESLVVLGLNRTF